MKTIPNYSNTDIRVRDIYIHQASKVADDGEYMIWKYTNHGTHYLIVTVDDTIHAYGIFQETLITHNVWLLETLRVFLDTNSIKLKTLILSHIPVKMLQSTPNCYVDADVWDSVVESAFGGSVRIHDRKTMGVYTKEIFLKYIDTKLPPVTDLRYAYVVSIDPDVDKHNRISNCNTPPLYYTIEWDSEPYQHNFGTNFWKDYINIDCKTYDDMIIRLAATYPVRVGNRDFLISKTNEKMFFMFFDSSDFTIFRGYVSFHRARNDAVLIYSTHRIIDPTLTIQTMLGKIANHHKIQIQYHEFDYSQVLDMFGDEVKLYDSKNNEYVDHVNCAGTSSHYWVVNTNADIPQIGEWYTKFIHAPQMTYYFVNDIKRINTL